MFDMKKYKKKYNKKYNEEHREERRKYRVTHQIEIKEKRKERRLNLLNIISNGNPRCVRCDCDDIRLLEINHKNGGGSKEVQNGKKLHLFYRDILKGRRKTDDLELLCKVCNAWHALELKYGKLPYKVSFNGNKVK